jgi:hypothetical protein
MSTVATAFVQLMPSFTGGASAISKELDGPLTTASSAAGDKSGKEYGKKFGGAASGVLKAALGAAIVASATSFVKDSIAEARWSP